jgi:2-desacetyl-2-hydroxyethyl bacteriochlorophyllide A dehydrogenase
MNSLTLYFTAPRRVSLRVEGLPDLGPGEARVETRLSAISPGSELLIFRGEFPNDLAVDDSIAALPGKFAYPLAYGYSSVGEVVELGSGVDPAWLGQKVFAFQPHASTFIAPTEALIPLPEGLPEEEAIFLPNMETAVNFLMDGAPLIGEQVAVLGQGIVGLLTTALLARFPLASLITLDGYPLRRQASLDLGAQASLDPAAPEVIDAALRALQGERDYRGADLVYELSGNPAALGQAIALCGFNGRVVIGSWYGNKPTSLNLGGRFHRGRMRLISSQVSSLTPELSARWDKTRRLLVAWEMLGAIKPSRFITQRFPITHAEQAYRLLDEHPGDTIQVVLTYDA